MWAIDDDFDGAGYMNPHPTADDDELDDDPNKCEAAVRMVKPDSKTHTRLPACWS